MNILVVLGKRHDVIYSQLSYKNNVINKNSLNLDEATLSLQRGELKPDFIVISEEALSDQLHEIKTQISNLKEVKIRASIIFMITRLEIKDILDKLQKENNNIEIRYHSKAIIPSSQYDQILCRRLENKAIKYENKKNNQNSTIYATENSITSSEKKTSLFKRIFSKNSPNEEEISPTSELDKRLMSFSKGINRVIGITGHRGSACTSTAVNLACEASLRGLKTILVDMDIYNRSLNLYCSNFVESYENDKEMESSLIRCLAKPQEYEHHACYINSNLWVTGLAYDFQDMAVMDRFFSANKVINMLTTLRQSFNVIFLDLPFDLLKDLQEIILHIDTFGLCVSNNLYSVVTTLRNISSYLNKENIAYLNAKSKIVVTQYNDRMQYQGKLFTADQVSELFASDLSDDFNRVMPVAGIIRYTKDFDAQLETDIPIIESSSEYKEYYSSILLRLLEGAR